MLGVTYVKKLHGVYQFFVQATDKLTHVQEIYVTVIRIIFSFPHFKFSS